MNLENVIAKYTGRHVTRQQLERAMQLGGLAAEFAMGIGSTAEAVGVTENELLRVTDTIDRHTSTVRQVITADPGHPASPLSALDQLQGGRVPLRRADRRTQRAARPPGPAAAAPAAVAREPG